MSASTVRGRRQALGWSMEHLARRAGVSTQTIHRIETGKTLPHPLTREAIEAALERGEREERRGE